MYLFLFWAIQGEYLLDSLSIEDVHGVMATNLGSKIGYQMELVIEEQKRLLLAFDTQVCVDVSDESRTSDVRISSIQADLAYWQQAFNSVGSHASSAAEAEKVSVWKKKNSPVILVTLSYSILVRLL